MKLLVLLPVFALASHLLALTGLVRDSTDLAPEVPHPVDAVVPQFPIGPFIRNLDRFWDRFALTLIATTLVLAVLHLDHFITFEIPGYQFSGDEGTLLLYLIYGLLQLLWKHYFPTTMAIIIGLEVLMAAAMGLLS